MRREGKIEEKRKEEEVRGGKGKEKIEERRMEGKGREEKGKEKKS
jgi:hypothetical protein